MRFCYLLLLVCRAAIAQITPVPDTLMPGRVLADTVLRFPRLARTNTELANLYYGIGTDRLGGAKRETLDSGVVLRLTGQVDRLYRVQLAPNQTAYIPFEQVR